MIIPEMAIRIVAMDPEDIFNGVKTGEVNYEEFDFWLKGMRDEWINAGIDSVSGWTDFS